MSLKIRNILIQYQPSSCCCFRGNIPETAKFQFSRTQRFTSHWHLHVQMKAVTLVLSPVGCIMAWPLLSPLLPLWRKPNTHRGRFTYSNMLSWRSSDQCSAEGWTPHYWTQCSWSRSTGEGMSSPPVHLTRSSVMDCVIVCCDIAADRSLSTHLSVLSFPSSLFIVSAAHSLLSFDLCQIDLVHMLHTFSFSSGIYTYFSTRRD